MADIGISDDALGTNTISLQGVDAASFDVVGNSLYLKAGVVLDYESKASYGVSVSVKDTTISGSTAVTTGYSLAVIDVNESPTAVALSNTTNITFISPPVLVATDNAIKKDSESYKKLVVETKATLAERAIDFVSATESGGSTKLGLNLNTFFASGTTFQPTTRLSYYSIDPTSGDIKTLSYDPIQGGGARFYDRDGNGQPDFMHLSLIDGGYGDKDGKVNGTIVDPSTVGSVDLNPELQVNAKGILKASDKTNTAAPASLVIKASLEGLPSTANQIGYLVLEESQVASADLLDLATIRRQSKTLFTTLENNDVVLPGNTALSSEFLVINNQSFRFFEVVDGTLDQLTSTSDARLRFLSGSLLNPSSARPMSAQFSSSSGVRFRLDLQDSNQGLGALIGQEQGTAAVLDFSTFASGETVRGTLQMGREADYDSVTGFYRALDVTGSVRSASGGVVLPGEAGYAAAALRKDNLVDTISGLTIGDNQTSSRAIELRETSFIAPFAQVKGNTFFGFAAANLDGISHFRMLGTNMFGLEDQFGGGDRDFDDNVLFFKFNSVV